MMVIHKVVRRLRAVLTYLEQIHYVNLLSSYLISPPDHKNYVFIILFEVFNPHSIKQFNIGFDYDNPNVNEDYTVGELITYITRWLVLNDRQQGN